MIKQSILTFSVFAISIYNIYSQPQNLDKIIGRVGNSIILSSELNVLYEQKLKNNEFNAEITRCKVMHELMLQQLMVAQAERDSVIVTNEEVENELDQRMNYMIIKAGGKEQLERMQGKTVYQIKEENRKFFKDKLTSDAMERKIVEKVKITPYEVDQFFASLNTDSLDFIPASVTIREIQFAPKASEEMEQYAKEKLEGIRKDIVEHGKAFSTMASIYSMDPGSKDEGGEFYMEKENTDGAFFSAAMKLQAGEISPVFRSRFGYHIIQMVRKYSNTKAKVKHILIVPEVLRSNYNEAKALADSVYNLIKTNTITFNQALNKYSTDEYSKLSNGYIYGPNRETSLSMNDLDPSTATTIANLKEGEISEPILYLNPNTGAQYYRIVLLSEQVEPHRLNMKDDYALVQRQALSLKQYKYLSEYTKTIVPNFYIQLDDEFVNCEEFKGWKSNITKAK